MATNPIIKHQHPSMPHTSLVANLIGHSVTLQTISVSNSAHTQVIRSTLSPQSSGFLIQLFSYSYDGIVHTESYVSDI